MSDETAGSQFVEMEEDGSALLCPSAPPEWPEAQLIGVAEGTVSHPQIRYTGPRPVTAELLMLASPVTPTEVFRFAARCQENRCRQFDGARCRLAATVVESALANQVHSQAASASLAIPRCGIRPRCRWWHEQGVAACRRCTQIVTDDPALNPKLLAPLVL